MAPEIKPLKAKTGRHECRPYKGQVFPNLPIFVLGFLGALGAFPFESLRALSNVEEVVQFFSGVLNGRKRLFGMRGRNALRLGALSPLRMESAGRMGNR
jgi:hypothetical protein